MAAKESPSQRVKNILSSLLIGRDIRESKSGSENGSGAEGNAPHAVDPKDRDAFNHRVESFTTLKWLAKPVEFSPLVCARFGWENTGLDILKCVGCKAIICGQLPNVKKLDTYRESHMKLQESLIEGHQTLCPWRNNPSPECFLVALTWNQSETIQDLQTAYTDFIQRQPSLPLISFDTLQEIGLDEESFRAEVINDSDGSAEVCKSVFKGVPVNLPAFCLALFGWRKSGQSDIIICERCRRKVGLWGYKQTTSPENSPPPGESNGEHNHSPGDQDDQPSKSKKAKLSLKDGFDPISEHRGWCPWVLPTDRKPFISSLCQSTSPGASVNSVFQTPVRSIQRNPRSSQILDLREESDSLRSLANHSPMDQSLESSPLNLHGNGQATPISTSINRTDQPSLPPWKILLVLMSLWKPDNLQTASDLKSSPPIDEMSHIRRLLREWSSPRSLRRIKQL